MRNSSKTWTYDDIVGREGDRIEERRFPVKIGILSAGASVVRRLHTVDLPEFYSRNRIEDVEIALQSGALGYALSMKKLGFYTKVFSFAGGVNGEFFKKKLKESSIPSFIVDTEFPTGESIELVDRYGSFTYFDYAGDRISTGEYVKLGMEIRDTEERIDTFIFVGPIAEGLDNNAYAKFCSIAKKKGVKVVLDIRGAALRYALKAGADLMYADTDAVADYLFEKPTTLAECMVALRRIYMETGVPVLCVLGREGAVLCDGKNMHTVQIDRKNRAKRDFERAEFFSAFMKGWEFSLGDLEFAMRYALSYVSSEGNPFTVREKIEKARFSTRDM